jgi:RimJ/RimL family protein N-acetyltransferase
MIGKRVRFRPIEESDLASLASWLNDPELSHKVVGWSFPVSAAQQREWFARSLQDARNRRWMVDTLEGETIGLTGLWEIDWQNRHALTALKIGSVERRGRGYGVDAILTLMAYAFCEVNLERLWTEILAFNAPSYRAYVEKCGWKVEGILRRHAFRAGAYHDVLRVGILREEFLALPAAAAYLPARARKVVEFAPERFGGGPRHEGSDR